MYTVRRNHVAQAIPRELLQRSRVVQVLHAFRGQHEGTSLTTLAALTKRTPIRVLHQAAAANLYLRRKGSCWSILSEDHETEDGAVECYFWLVAPHCPRPSRRIVPELGEPEFISFDELEDEWPIMPRWE